MSKPAKKRKAKKKANSVSVASEAVQLPDPQFQRDGCSQHSRLIATIWQQAKKPIARVWGALLIVSALLGYLVLIPSITLQPSSTTDSKDPFATRWYVSNESLYRLDKASYSCLAHDILDSSGKELLPRVGMLSIDGIGTLPPKSQYSIKCDNFGITDEMWGYVSRATVDIHILTCIPMLKVSYNKVFEFKMVKDKDGIVQWLPYGPGPSGIFTDPDNECS